MEKVKISVVIPVYNAEATIVKCLEALTKQTWASVEIIVVDDGSSDGSVSKIKKAKSKLKIKNLILFEQNHGGAAKARNLGAQRAKGEIVAFTDADCLPPRNWLKRIVKAFANSEVGMVGGGYSSGIDQSFWQRFSNEELAHRRFKRKGETDTLVSNNMACRKKCFLEAKGFPEQYPVCEDMLLSFKISSGHKVLWLKENGVKHHFKNSLGEFLKHQYFFGKKSTQFFLENPRLLLVGNHQGKTLHLAIVTSFFSLTIFMAAIFFLIWSNFPAAKILFGFFLGLLLIHLALYFGFLFYLQKKDFSFLEIIKAYLVSYVRDLLSGFSFFDGFTSFKFRS